MKSKTTSAPAAPATPGTPIPRKPADRLKGEQIHIRITATQKETLVAAAAREGYELSAWIRAAALRAAGALPK